MRLEDRRILVVGASSGIGRATGLAAAAEGARVAFAARRVERVEEAAAKASGAGAGAIALPCDVRDEAACERAVAAAAEAFGGLDAIVYAPGIAVFKPIETIVAAEWRDALDVNLVGATAVCRAALPHLSVARGKAVFLSSISIHDQPPRYGSAPYVVTKVALEALVRAWQGEHIDVSFSTIAVGDTRTEFGHDADMAQLGPIVQKWVEGGYLFGRVMDAESVAEQIVNVLASREAVAHLEIQPRRAEKNPFGMGM